MNKAEFITLIENPKSLDKSHITALKNIAADFPYFQASHILLSKALFNENHYEFEKQLKSTALIVSDREVLYRFLHDLNIDQAIREPNLVHSSAREITEITEVLPKEIVLEKTGEEIVEELSTVDSNHADLSNEILELGQAPVDEPAKIELTETVVETAQPQIFEIAEGVPPEIVLEKTAESGAEELLIKEDSQNTGLPDEVIEQDEEPVDESAMLGLTETVVESGQNENPEMTEDISQEIILEKTPEVVAEELPIEDSGGYPESIDEIIKENEVSAARQAEIGLTETVSETDHHEVLDEAGAIEKVAAKVESAFETGQTTVEDNEPEILHHKEEVHSFAEWLMLGSEKIKEEPVGRQSHEKVQEVVRETERDERQVISAPVAPADNNIYRFESILDKFIKENPRMSRPKAEFYNPAIMASQSNEEDDDLVTETLANIYYQQGAHKKAIRAYEKLCLIYPHKMTFFADLIHKIKEENKND